MVLAELGPTGVELLGEVDRVVLEELVERLGLVLAAPGDVPPAARRLRDAGAELLSELDGVGQGRS